MDRQSQLAITILTLGGVIAFIGLFPGVIGLDVAAGVGLFQMTVILVGLTLLILGALYFVQANYYPGQPHTLGQQIGIRLAATGLIVSFMSGLADVLGVGTHPPIEAPSLLGPWQTAGLIGGFVVASIGVILFALLGISRSE
jgi:hypothetical protein